MITVEEAIAELNEELWQARMDVAVIERCLSYLERICKGQGDDLPGSEPETPPDNSHEDEPPEPIHQVKNSFVGVYPVGKMSKKWYASVTERSKTKRLPGTYDTPEEANAARSGYLAKRDGEPAGSGSGQGPKHILSPSNEAVV